MHPIVFSTVRFHPHLQLGSQNSATSSSSMDYCTPQPSRRHNPVDSICRKLQTIQWRGDREPNSPFQIPKISASSIGSPQCAARRDLEAIVKKSTLHRDKEEKREGGGGGGGGGRGRGIAGMPSSSTSKRSVPQLPPSSLCTPTPASVTYTITSSLGERRCADGGSSISSDLRHSKVWQRQCSTPTTQSKESPYFTFTQEPWSAGPNADETPSRSPAMSRTFTPSLGTVSYNLSFSSAEPGDGAEGEHPYPALVVKRLSMGDGGRQGEALEVQLSVQSRAATNNYFLNKCICQIFYQLID